MKRAILAVVFVAACAASAIAQEKAPTPGPSAAAAAPSDEGEAAPAGDASMEVDGDLSEQGVMAAIPWRSALTSHIHNKIVHFPLALGMAAAFLLIVAPRWPSYEPAARVLLIMGALAAVIAYFSGTAQEDQFDDSPFHAVVELHEKFGIATALTLWTGAALTFWPRARRFMPVYGVLLLLLLSGTGFLGGVLSHS